MQGRTIGIVLITTLIGFIAGFFVANSMTRREMASMTAEAGRSSSTPAAANGQSPSLSPEEIAATIRRADQNPRDFQTQKQIGGALYRYAAMKEDTDLLKQAITILDRAASLQPNDREIMVTIGNAHFDIGYFAKDNKSLARAREFYSKALAAKADDPDVRTDVGLSYFLETPPRMDLAAAEFRKSLDVDPRHEKTLTFIVQALAKQEKRSDAEKYLEQLKSINPQNSSIGELTEMINGARQPAG